MSQIGAMHAGAYVPPKYNFNRFCHRLVNLLEPERRLQFPGAVIQQTVRLADTSIYEGLIDIDQFVLSGARGIIPKVSQGNWEDDQFRNTWTNAKGRTRRGGYHFYDPRYSPTAQLSTFLSLIQDDPGELALVCDWEFGWTGAYSSWSNLYAFLHGLLNAGFSAERLYLYTGYYYWLDHSPNPITQPASLAWFAQFPLWLAWYTTDPSLVRIPKPWTALKWWQDTESGNGSQYGAASGAIDLDWYNGSAAQFENEYPIGATDPIAYVVKRPKVTHDLCATPGTGELPLLSAVEHAQANSWECAMNGGVGFDYTDATHAIPRTDAQYLTASNGARIYFNKPMLTNGVVNPELAIDLRALPWCVLAEDAEYWYLIITRGSGMTPTQAAEFARSQGAINAWMEDSDRSAQIEENGVMLYWPYGDDYAATHPGYNPERVPQAIGLKAKGASMILRYSAVWPAKARALKADHIVNAVQVGTINAGAVAHGDELFTAPADVVLNGTLYQKAGDVWLRVLDIDGVLVKGWTAIVHLGVVQMTLTDTNPPPPPPAPVATAVVQLNLNGQTLLPKSINPDGTVNLG